MKLKRLLPPTLFLLLLGLMNLNAQETQPLTMLPTDSPTKYGLEFGKSYSAEIVAQLLDAAVEEGRTVVAEEVKKAYNEGYKAGVADFAPGSAYWESFSASLSKEAKLRPTWGTVAIAGIGGLLIGMAGLGITAFILAR